MTRSRHTNWTIRRISLTKQKTRPVTLSNRFSNPQTKAIGTTIIWLVLPAVMCATNGAILISKNLTQDDTRPTYGVSTYFLTEKFNV